MGWVSGAQAVHGMGVRPCMGWVSGAQAVHGMGVRCSGCTWDGCHLPVPPHQCPSVQCSLSVPITAASLAHISEGKKSLIYKTL
ncbi:unnamed protein product [Staurois parvus]|uniref:Secreted protein n=1 Tax=Staurois parvus TaxID=386267 RepID=A0ABN9ER18_9NEOB|nr:unnamed protein product [Staurois parvus]